MEEGKGSRVRVHSKLRVMSSTPIEPNKVHKLSALDHAMALHTLHVIFYYRANPFHEGPMELDLDNLRITLSDHLCLYPPVTGRLVRDGEGNWEVKCNDAGIRMVRASVGVTVDEWLRSADASEERDLTVWENMPQDPIYWSPLRIQALEDSELGHVVALVHKHVTGIEEGEFWSAVDWFESQKGEKGKYAAPFRMYGPELTCISMEHMSCADESLMYSAMFREEERPVHVSYNVGNVGGKGLIMVMPSPGDRVGRTVMLSLPENQISILSQDEAIMELDPQMLISGRR
ncbi:protein ECERIFERUM 26-like isoform X2 [Ipomoea triloba]|uniref:protein ECERIFERUM 26-like isoform X2 n=1 Tax=Ipomoea triloba TaxID=35885 RepID=UPI00125E37CA|nr:protein ECERIFERUM 26-like isoform X2 [Ipomoea triloba]